MIRLERHRADGSVALLVFDDPERRNAMTEAMGRAVSDAIVRLSADASVRAVVLTGAGSAFSAGGDLAMLEEKSAAGRAAPGGSARGENRAFMRAFYRLFLSVRDLPCPSIAAINGAAIGAGLAVALACDLRVASRDAKLGLNFTKLGIHPGMGSTWTLPRLVGSAHAAELLYTGRIVDGAEAERIGMVNRCAERDAVVATALAIAGEIADAAPIAVRGTKQALRNALAAQLDEQLAFEAEQQAICYESADLAEGLRATREKRTPVFRGE
ncbi:MAG: enoyl-CoA hydratase [Proteobacteria bacterium]|nr:MAG: enoyl-CoA hydratase [Pseudomonadota bacterium]